MDIFDSILFEGSYSETISIKNKLKITFRSRTVDEVMEINTTIDSKDLKTSNAMVDEQLLQHLAYAIENYNGKDWRGVPIAQKIAELKKLPAPLMQTLSSKLSDFDKKVREACEESEENFSETPGQEQG